MQIDQSDFFKETIFQYESYSDWCSYHRIDENLFLHDKFKPKTTPAAFMSTKRKIGKVKGRKIKFSFKNRPANSVHKITSGLEFVDIDLRIRLLPSLNGEADKCVKPKSFKPLLDLFDSSIFIYKKDVHEDFFLLLKKVELSNVQETYQYLENKNLNVVDITAGQISTYYEAFAENLWDDINEYIVPKIKKSLAHSKYGYSYFTLIQKIDSFTSIKLMLDSLSTISGQDQFLEIIKEVDFKLYSECIFILTFFGILTLEMEGNELTENNFELYVSNSPSLFKSNAISLKTIYLLYYFPMRLLNFSSLNKAISYFTTDVNDSFHNYLSGINYYEYKETTAESIPETVSHMKHIYDIIFQKVKKYRASFSPTI